MYIILYFGSAILNFEILIYSNSAVRNTFKKRSFKKIDVILNNELLVQKVEFFSADKNLKI